MTDVRPKIGLLVVDLDDTLWTWFDAWHKSFSAMLEKLSAVTGLSEEDLLPEIKSVHEQRGTVEYSWLLDELPILERFRLGRKANEIEELDSALHAQHSARKYNTLLYPGVLSTLRYLKANGVTVVAYTESLSYWTEWRMRETQLDGLIDVLYSSPDHDFPAGETRQTVRTLPAEDYGLKRTVHENTEKGISKPDPQILREIIEAHKVAGRGVVYVGDSLERDIQMAKKLNVFDVHAKYGEKHHEEEYDLLRAVTHWTSTEVEQERRNDPNTKVTSTYVLEEGFYQLLTLFDFETPFNIEAHLQLQQEAVNVQMHFNDIGWRIRSLALTLLTFTLAAIGYAHSLDDLPDVHIREWEISSTVFLPIIAAFLWSAFWFVDRGWFHKLLIGAVKEGQEQEKILQEHGIQANLGGSIKEESSIQMARSLRGGKGLLKINSSWKLNIFYFIGFLSLVAITVTIWYMET